MLIIFFWPPSWSELRGHKKDCNFSMEDVSRNLKTQLVLSDRETVMQCMYSSVLETVSGIFPAEDNPH